MHKQERFLASIAIVLIHIATSLSLLQPHDSRVIPPVITVGPSSTVFFNPNSRQFVDNFTCTAEGSQMRSAWYILTNDGGNSLAPVWKYWREINSTKPTVNFPDRLEPGFYQCRAYNSAGTAISAVVHFQQAEFSHDGSSAEVHTRLGGAFVRKCDHAFTYSVPTATNFMWRKYVSEIDTMVDIAQGEGFDFDAKSSPYIIVQQVAEKHSNMKLMCNTYNAKLRHYEVGSEFKITVDTSTKVEMGEESVVVYISNETTVIQGNSIELLCVFSPSVTVTWTHNGFALEHRGSRYTITNATKNHSGEYRCTSGRSSGTINLTVDELPSLTTSLKNQNVTSGETVTLRCLGQGRPTPSVTWYINGEEVNGGGNGELVKSNVDHSFSVSCNVSNKHGYRMYGAYVMLLPAVTVNVETTAPTTSSRPTSAEMMYRISRLSRTTIRTTSRDSRRLSNPSLITIHEEHSKSTSPKFESQSANDLLIQSPDSNTSYTMTILISVGCGVAGTLIIVIVIVTAYCCGWRTARRTLIIDPDSTQGSVLMTRMHTLNVNGRQQHYDDYGSDGDSGVGDEGRQHVRSICTGDNSEECEERLKEINEEDSEFE